MGRVKNKVARGTPRVIMHLEAETPACICPRISGCGGVEEALLDCPEHGGMSVMGRYHTHAIQVNRIAVGTAFAL